MIIIKFIFPQNYCFKQKLFGFIDYSTLFFPSLIFSIVGFNHEKITYILKYLFIYLKSPKYYLFKKY